MKKDRFARRLQLVRTTVRQLTTNDLKTIQGGGDAVAAAAAIGGPGGPVTTTSDVPTTCELRYTLMHD